MQPLHPACGRHVACRHATYRLAEVPTDSTLEWVKAGIPHPPCKLELDLIELRDD